MRRRAGSFGRLCGLRIDSNSADWSQYKDVYDAKQVEPGPFVVRWKTASFCRGAGRDAASAMSAFVPAIVGELT
jgi:hypothetical protein